MDNYEQLVSRLAESSGLKNEELERKIEAKRAKLSGLVSKEEEVGFGIKAILAKFAWPEEKNTDLIENIVSKNRARFFYENRRLQACFWLNIKTSFYYPNHDN